MREKLVKNYAARQSRQGTNSLEDIEADMRNLYLPGQSRTLDSPEEMSKDLLQRDGNHLANFDGKLPIGATIIPQNYVPKNPRIVQPERKNEVSHCLPSHFVIIININIVVNIRLPWHAILINFKKTSVQW